MFGNGSLRATVSGAWLWLLLGGEAHAYCRATTSPKQAGCFEACVEEGLPLAWARPTIRYVFHEGGFPDLDEGEQRAVFARAFRQWEDVTCAEEPIGLMLEAERSTTSLGPRPQEESPTVNVIGHLSAQEWREDDNDPRAFAVTKVRFIPDSGVIVGADIWFNGGMGRFGVCPEEGCPLDALVDLPNVATHEAGHLLGLAHSSDEPGSTMECSASAGDTDKRSLAQDDRDGLCASYPPGVAFGGDYIDGKWAPLRRAEKASCGVVGVPGGGAARVWCVPVALFALRRRWRGSARRARTPAA